MLTPFGYLDEGTLDTICTIVVAVASIVLIWCIVASDKLSK